MTTTKFPSCLFLISAVLIRIKGELYIALKLADFFDDQIVCCDYSDKRWVVGVKNVEGEKNS